MSDNRSTRPVIIGSSATDEELMLRVRGSDTAAFELLVYRYQKSALRLAVRFTGQQAEAEELAQEAFWQVYRRADQYRPEVAPFKTWFFTILSNLCRNAVRRNKFLSFAEPPAERAARDDPAHELEAKEQRTALARAIRNLPPQQRLALLLCHYEEFSYAEAAATLDVSVKAVESLLVRAKRTLRQELAGGEKKS